MRIDPSQTLNTHDTEHFCQALLAVKQARSLTGNDIDRLCFLPLGTTTALLRGDRAIHVRYVLRYCKDLDIDPVKPWGIATCQYCINDSGANGTQVEVADCASVTDAITASMTASERLTHIIRVCTMLLHEVEQAKRAVPSSCETLLISWRQVSREDQLRFVREMLSQEERDALTEELLAIETRTT